MFVSFHLLKVLVLFKCAHKLPQSCLSWEVVSALSHKQTNNPAKMKSAFRHIEKGGEIKIHGYQLSHFLDVKSEQMIVLFLFLYTFRLCVESMGVGSTASRT